MNCIQCDGAMVNGPVTLSGKYRGLPVSVEMPDGWKCESCGYATIAGKYTATFGDRLRAKYQEERNLLDARQIRSMRESLALSQKAFAEASGISIATMKRLEARGCTNVAYDQTVRDTYARLATTYVSFNERLIEFSPPSETALACWTGVSKAMQDYISIAESPVLETEHEAAPKIIWTELGQHVWNVGAKCSALFVGDQLAQGVQVPHAEGRKAKVKEARSAEEDALVA